MSITENSSFTDVICDLPQYGRRCLDNIMMLNVHKMPMPSIILPTESEDRCLFSWDYDDWLILIESSNLGNRYVISDRIANKTYSDLTYSSEFPHEIITKHMNYMLNAK